MARCLLALGALLVAGVWQARAEPPHCPQHDPPRCVPGGHGHNEYIYTVDGLNLLLQFTDGDYFTLNCPENLTLNNSNLPRFESQLRVNKVHLHNCVAPRDSYAALLAALNVHVLDRLKLRNAGTVTHSQLAGLDTVRTLELVNVQLAPGALAGPSHLRRLHRLFLDNVRLPPGGLSRDELPVELQMLDLTRMNTDVPPELLDALPDLVNVTVRDSHNVIVALGRHVKVLALELPAAHVPSALPSALQSLAVFGWDEPQPAPWAACSALRSLSVRDVKAAQLPADWVRACAELRVLSVQFGPQLRELHAAMLRDATNLTELRITSCKLESLPSGLLDDATNLRVLDLTENSLHELPGGLFARTTSLQILTLAHNKLSSDVYSSLKAVTSLGQLDLSFNELRDSCGGASDTVRGVSPLERLNKLTYLKLKKTNTSLICRDWRDSMPLLEKLDLSANEVTSVTYADLQFPGNKPVEVILTGNNVTQLLYTQDDYSRALHEPVSRAVVTLDSTLACDCDAYWAARALRERQAHVQLSGRCASIPAALHDVALDQLQCDAPDLCAGTRCACAWTRTGATPARALIVRCERKALRRLRNVTRPLQAALRSAQESPADYDWRLYLAHNRISELDAADIPEHLSVLDLSNNSLSRLSSGVTRALLADERRRVRLAGNPLVCNCSAAGTVLALKAQQQVLQDYAHVTCADGSLLATAPSLPCAPPRGLGAGVAAAGAALCTLLAAGALAGLLWHPAVRLRLKAALHRRGWLPAAPEDDAGRRYDVFLSFSHGDERFVRDELVTRLEAPPDPLRLCVHYRDWAPGGWIPAQIAASVRASRRTVAVVSEHFLRSAWARAEFQEAHALALRDARPRLVVVLLDDPAALPLDERLRRYLQSNTYVRWGDPFFWQKLRLALPRGRLPAPAGPQPARPVPAEPAPEPDVTDVPEPAAASLNSATSESSDSSNSSATCSRSMAGSEMELDRLMPGCGAHYGGVPVRTCAVPVPV